MKRMQIVLLLVIVTVLVGCGRKVGQHIGREVPGAVQDRFRCASEPCSGKIYDSRLFVTYTIERIDEKGHYKVNAEVEMSGKFDSFQIGLLLYKDGVITVDVPLKNLWCKRKDVYCMSGKFYAPDGFDGVLIDYRGVRKIPRYMLPYI